MAWFSPFTSELVELTPEEIMPEPVKQLTGIDPQKTRDSIARGLASSREKLAALEIEEARIQLAAEHTRLTIAALEAAEKVMSTAATSADEGDDQSGIASDGTTVVVVDTLNRHLGNDAKADRVTRRVPRYARD